MDEYRYTGALCVVLLGSLAGGCESVPPEPDSEAPTAVAALTEQVPGYEHALERSSFDIGYSVTPSADLDGQRLVGENGVFATLPNGAALARPNADALSRVVPAYGSNADEHNDHTRAYFVAAGIPEDQIEGVYANVLGFATQSADGNLESDGSPQFAAWYSVVRREVGGTPVVDSVAWARFNANDQVVSETVYWPPLPMDVIEDAESFTAHLATSAHAATYTAKLPAGQAGPGRVVVRHTSFSHRGAFVARAVYDVPYQAGGASTVRHFDLTGAEVRMPEEEP